MKFWVVLLVLIILASPILGRPIGQAICCDNTCGFGSCDGGACTIGGSSCGSTGGGGGGTKVTTPTTICTSSWSCTSWSTCSGGIQIRVCTDLNSCNPSSPAKPAESQSCIVPTSPAGCCEHTSCDYTQCYGKSAFSSTQNDCVASQPDQASFFIGGNPANDGVNCLPCASNWNYGAWSACNNGYHTRTGTDSNSCNPSNPAAILSGTCAVQVVSGSCSGRQAGDICETGPPVKYCDATGSNGNCVSPLTIECGSLLGDGYPCEGAGGEITGVCRNSECKPTCILTSGEGASSGLVVTYTPTTSARAFPVTLTTRTLSSGKILASECGNLNGGVHNSPFNLFSTFNGATSRPAYSCSGTIVEGDVIISKSDIGIPLNDDSNYPCSTVPGCSTAAGNNMCNCGKSSYCMENCPAASAANTVQGAAGCLIPSGLSNPPYVSDATKYCASGDVCFTCSSTATWDGSQCKTTCAGAAGCKTNPQPSTAYTSTTGYCVSGSCYNCAAGYTYDTASSSCKPNCGTISGTICSVPEDFDPNQILGTTYYCSGTSDVCACSTTGYIATNNHCCPSGESYDTASSSCKPDCPAESAGTINIGCKTDNWIDGKGVGNYNTQLTYYCGPTLGSCRFCDTGYTWDTASVSCKPNCPAASAANTVQGAAGCLIPSGLSNPPYVSDATKYCASGDVCFTCSSTATWDGSQCKTTCTGAAGCKTNPQPSAAYTSTTGYCASGSCYNCAAGYTYDTASSSCKPNCPTESTGTINIGCKTDNWIDGKGVGNYNTQLTYYCGPTLGSCRFCNAGYHWDSGILTCKADCGTAGNICCATGTACTQAGTYCSSGKYPSYPASNDKHCCLNGKYWDPSSGCTTDTGDCTTTWACTNPWGCLSGTNACCSTSVYGSTYNFWMAYTQY